LPTPVADLSLNVHDPNQDGLLLEDVSHGPEAALTENEFQPVGHADGLEQTFLANAVGQFREVAHVLAVAMANLDGGNFEVFEHGPSSKGESDGFLL